MNTKTTQSLPAFRRVLLKISGEALVGEQTFGIDVDVARSVAEEIKQVHDLGVEVAAVVGCGNIFHGLSKSAGNMCNQRSAIKKADQRSLYFPTPTTLSLSEIPPTASPTLTTSSSLAPQENAPATAVEH